MADQRQDVLDAGSRRVSAPVAVLAAALLLAAACGGGDSGSAGGDGGADAGSRPLVTGPATEVAVSPSASPQTVALGTGVQVTLPGGFLSAGATFSSAEVQQLQRDLTGPIGMLGAFEVSCRGCPSVGADGGVAGFGQEITLLFSYDPAELDPGLDEGKGIFVAYWDEERQNWTMVPFEVDTAANRLIVKTDHLCTWAYWTARGYKSVTTAEGHFDVYYNPKHAVPLLANPDGYDMRGFAGRVGELMEIAYGRFKAVNFTMPRYLTTSTIKVIVTDDLRWVWETVDLGRLTKSVYVAQSSTSPYYSATSGNVFLKLAQLTNETEISTDGAHELFHVVQNQYANVKSMERNLWWYEGTPDYASYAVAWQKAIPLDRFYEPTPADYFATPLNANEGEHAYQMVRFLDYLNVKLGIEFKPLWDAVLGKSDLLIGFESHVGASSTKTFAEAWRSYVAWMFFDPAAKLDPSAEGKYLAVGTTSFPYTFYDVAGPYAARAMWVKAKLDPSRTSRDVKVSATADLPSGLDVEVWMLPGGAKASATLKSVLTGSVRSSGVVTLTATDQLYAIAMNLGKTAQTVAMKVEEVVPDPNTTPVDNCKFPKGGGQAVTLSTSSRKCYDSKTFSLCFSLNPDGSLTQAADPGCQSFLKNFTVTGTYTCNAVNLNYRMSAPQGSSYPGCGLTEKVTKTVIYQGSVALTWDPTARTYSVGANTGTLDSSYSSPTCTVTFPTCTATDLTVLSAK